MLNTCLFLDFETYYHQQLYTLRKMTPAEYILDERFEVILCSVAINGGDPFIVEGPQMGELLEKIDPAVTATVTFNSLFDNSILSWAYGWTPALMIDSMNMARCLRGHILPKLNLEAVSKGVLGIVHDKTAIIKASGKHREEMKADPAFWREFCDYSNRDNLRSRDIFLKLLPEFPKTELDVMDSVIRCTVQPRFMVDRAKLNTHLTNIRQQKVDLLNACGYNVSPSRQMAIAVGRAKGDLLSAVKFKEKLEELGVEIKYKSGTNGPIPAFAKTDGFMEELQNHFDTRVQALACARLGIKSTIEESRTERLIKIAALPWSHYRDGNMRFYSGGEMPVPLRYAGAHTMRLSGDWKLNMQNMPAGRAGKTNMLRQSLIAPPGYLCVAGDLSQIEARLTAWLARCMLLINAFAAYDAGGQDPYCAFGSRVFGFEVTPKHTIHRFISKTGVLGLQYYCGAEKFYNMVLTLARLGGIDFAQAGIEWTRTLAHDTVYGYRGEYREIPAIWRLLGIAIESVWCHNTSAFMNVGPVTIRYGEIEGPNGLKMKYADPRLEPNGEYVYDYGFSHGLKMYSGLMLQNIIELLARTILMNAALRLIKLGYRYSLQAHDELAFIVPEGDCQNACAIIKRELTRRPSWAPDLPLNASVKAGKSYGDCK